MEKRVLVAYATKYGATAEIAQAIGDTLRKASLTVDVAEVDATAAVATYDAVVLGSAVYAGHWRKEAVEFLDVQKTNLADRPVWIFSSGPTSDGDPIEAMDGWRFPEAQQPLADFIGPKDITVFGGYIESLWLNVRTEETPRAGHPALQDVRVRRDLPDSVHQMRVAARRLRSGLKAFEPMLDVEWAEALRTELGWIAGELGVSRDTEVLQARIDLHADEVGEEFSGLIRAVVDPALSSQWRDARDHALAAMVSQRYRDFLDRLVDAARNPRLNEVADAPSEDVLPGLVDKAWKKLKKEVDLLRLDGPSDDWHEARIRAKKARYAAEAVAPVMGERVKRFAKALSQVTEVLGEHQDAWVAQQTLKSLAAGDGIDGLSGFSLGLLHEFEFEQELFCRNDFVEIWPGVRKAHKKARLR